MALIDSEGFGLSTAIADYVNYGLFNMINSTTGLSIGTGGPLGDNYMSAGLTGTDSTGLVRILPSTYSTFFWGARVAIPATGSSFAPNLVFYDASGSTEQFHLHFDGISGQITALRGNTSLGASAAGAIPIAGGALNWAYLEVGAVLSATVGTITVKVNGTSVLALTGLNNCGGTGTVCGAWGNGHQAGQGGNAGSFSMMHHYFADNSGSSPWNTYLGDVRVQTLLPTADDSVAFTPNGLGTNHANAALVPPVPGTDFNSDATVNAQDTFTCASLAASITTIFGVNAKVLAQKSDAGSRSLQTVLKSSSTTVTGTGTALQQTPEQLRTMYQTDPNTSAQWTAANVNAAKVGYKVSA
jgi:hypothetical protein